MKTRLLWLKRLAPPSLAVMLVLTMAGCAASKPAASLAPAQTPTEGIKVHGYWTIDVKNPDGTLASHREFENELLQPGSSYLTRLLGRQSSVGGWVIELTASTSSSDQAFMDQSSNNVSGLIVESPYPWDHPYAFKNLTVTVPTSGANNGKLVLSGTATAQRNGKIEMVKTLAGYTDPTLPPSATGGYVVVSNFTGTILSSAINLVTGQQITVTVVISFS